MATLGAPPLSLPGTPASIKAKPWSFTQVGSPSFSGNQSTIVLSGYSAPFGRPRKTPVVTDGYGLRDSETYYNGFGQPTRHIFGDIHDVWTLHGRWMDSVLGQGGARALVQQFKLFIRNALPCQISWGDVMAFTGLLHHLKTSRESEAQIAWELTIKIDSDDTLQPAVVPNPQANLNSQLGLFLASQATFQLPSSFAPSGIVFPTGFLDSIDNLVSTIAAYTGSLVAVADGMEDFENATSAELNRFRGVIGQVQTAYVTLGETLDSSQCDFGVGAADANSQSAWAQEREANEIAIATMLSLLVELDLQTEIAIRSEVQQTARTQSGDTWETLSMRHYGSIDKADTLRQANLVRYGQRPQAGRPISIPKP